MTKDFMAFDLEDQALFQKHRLQEIGSYEWSWLRPALNQICDLEEYLLPRGKSMHLEKRPQHQRAAQVDFDEYIWLQAEGQATGQGTQRRHAGGASAGKTVASMLRWWRNKMGLLTPEIKDPPQQLAPAAKLVWQRRGQAVPT